jgi:hypothetical protein
MMLHIVVDYGIIMNNDIINVLLNCNVCNSHGREILFSPLREFFILRNPVSVIGMCLHVMNFRVCVMLAKCMI